MKFGSMGGGNNKKEAQKRERALAKRLGGQATPNSGAIDGQKGDVVLDKYLVDDKFTGQSSYTLKKSEMDKISREARERNREPMFVIKFTKGVPKNCESEWALLPKRLCDLAVFDKINIKNKSRILPISTLGSWSTRSLKEEKEPVIEVEFFKRTLGVDSSWILAPLTLFEERGYFE